MKIALVIERMDPRRGGRERSTAQIARHLAEAGCGVNILCYQADWQDTGVNVRLLPIAKAGRLETLRRFNQAVSDEVANGDYDIVHGTLPLESLNVYQPRGGTLPGQRAASLRRRRHAAKLSAWLGWKTNPVRRQLVQWERQIVESGRVRCLAVSEMVAREFQDHYGRDAEVVFNGADPPPMSPEMVESCRKHKRMALGAGPDAPVFVSIATNWKLKAVDSVIRAFGRLVDRTGGDDARLVCIGQDEPARYALLAEKLGLGRLVDFPGRLDDAWQWYTVATGTVLLSWYDPCSRVVLESIGLGVPAITTRFNGAAEALTDGAGIVVDSPRAVEQVAQAMARLADAQQRAEFQEACNVAAGRVSMHHHTEQLLSVYQKVAASR
ncbi:MAG: glycosyltransferase family 4 protein [Phycisphaerae bacterium]